MNIKIYQKEDSQFIFEPKPKDFEEVQKNFKLVDERKFYFKSDVYTSNTSILKHVYSIYNNTDFLQGYKGRSLTCGDVVVLDDIPYFCDKFGWEKI